MLERLLRSGAEVRVLGVVLFSDGLHLREIARRAGVSPPEAMRELNNLVSLGALVRKTSGNACLFFLNRDCLFVNDLKGLYLKTEGLVPLLKKEVSEIKGLKYCFIYGSFARGGFGAGSDVDVLLVGNVSVLEVSRVFGGLLVAGKSVNELNYVVWSNADFDDKVKEGSAFFKSVLKNRKVWLFGDEREFKRDVEKARGSKS